MCPFCKGTDVEVEEKLKSTPETFNCQDCGSVWQGRDSKMVIIHDSVGDSLATDIEED